MANEWFRLWHDMPNDPKWRSISRAAKQPIALVISVYIHLLADGSRNVTRGHVTVTNEDLASALDVEESDISAIISAMQGRVLDGSALSGWESRQRGRDGDAREASGAKSDAERKRDQRAREKAKAAQHAASIIEDASRPVTEMSPDVTLDKSRQDNKNTPHTPRCAGGASTGDSPSARSKKITFSAWLDELRKTGEKAISDYKPVWEYAERAKLPRDFVELAWLRFREKYMTDERAKAKKYADWRRAFRNCVEGNWLRLWFWSEQDTAYNLTTVGKQADIAVGSES